MEQKIQGKLYGEPTRHFSAILGYRELVEDVQDRFGPTHPFTALSPKLAGTIFFYKIEKSLSRKIIVGVDPDDSYSSVPYQKGSTFLWYLEDIVGGPDKMEAFLRFSKILPLNRLIQMISKPCS